MTPLKSHRIVQIRNVAAMLLHLANELESEEPNIKGIDRVRVGLGSKLWKDLSSELIVSKVIKEYNLRRLRKKYLPEYLFGEPGWDILLDLLISKIRNRKISVTSACIASDVPATTALRWISELEKNGLIEREKNSFDQRVTWIELTDSGLEAMFEYFSEVGVEPQLPFNKIGDYLVINEDHADS